MENNFGKGALIGKKDKRDYQYKDAIKAYSIPPFDWSLGYDIEQVIGKELNLKNQNGSGSCGGQAWAYYGQALDPDKVEKSAKFIYAHTFVPPDGGSWGRDNCKIVKEKGWGDESKTTSYENGNPPSETFMRRKEDITTEAYTTALLDRALSYAQVSIDIDSMAQAIRDNKGMIIGITGKNNGTWTSVFPTPPNDINNNWRHWVYCGRAKMVDGKKYIGFKNSWGNVGIKGWQYIREDYIKPKWIFDTYTLVYGFPLFKFTKTLKYGMIDNEVKELQKRLGVIQTSFFGPLTLKAVKSYQKSKGLVADGIVGPKTRLKLNS